MKPSTLEFPETLQSKPAHSLTGAGLGFRRELLKTMEQYSLDGVKFFELAPENWIDLGGRYREQLLKYTRNYPFVCHGLSLSIGSTDPLDEKLLQKIKQFMDEHEIELYTEHLSWCSHEGHLYDLLPIPFTEEAAHWVAQRIKRAQEILERPIGIENSSYYFAPAEGTMSEEDFIIKVLNEANCLLHLDVNNVFVNSTNLKYDPIAFIQALPAERVCYLHVAGHYVEEDGWIVDTHGADVIDPVWQLLEKTYEILNKDARMLPTCLERDFNFSNFEHLLQEVRTIQEIQTKYSYSEATP